MSQSTTIKSEGRATGFNESCFIFEKLLAVCGDNNLKQSHHKEKNQIHNKKTKGNKNTLLN